MKTHEEKMRVVHALWLCHVDGEPVENTISRAQMLLNIKEDMFADELIFEDLGEGYIDMAFCGRRPEWVYSDSVKFLFDKSYSNYNL